ncbi:hypothetical protein QZH41_011795 [Actinostola sp. cb2023]|nr:hypothetical protein QZH41_011795 [Actinostola sp. cb2023]
MDEVVKNTHAFVDILCMARGQAVQSWGEETFHRAFKWAQYFEQPPCNTVRYSLESNPNHSFWSLPLPILSRISFQYDDILKLYLDGLVSWGNKMTPLLTYQLPIKERPIHNQVYVWR